MEQRYFRKIGAIWDNLLAGGCGWRVFGIRRLDNVRRTRPCLRSSEPDNLAAEVNVVRREL